MPSNVSGRFAAATSIVALVVAMGGTGYAAAGKITGHDIKKNAINSAKVKNDSLTGKDINESALGQVPSAATAGSATHATHAGSADSANSAGNAGTVNGVKASKVFYQANVGGSPATIFSGSGLTVTASCTGAADITLTASTSIASSSIYATAFSDSDPDNPTEADLESGGFSPGTPFDLLAGGDGNIDMLDIEFDTPTGNVVTAQLAVDEAGNLDCSATGMVLSQ